MNPPKKKKKIGKDGEYILDRKIILGRSFFGIIYKGTTKNSDSVVAIKQVPIPNYLNLEEYKRMIEDQIKAMKSLSHDNIQKFEELIYSRRNLYFVAEFCDGGDLENVKFQFEYKNVLTILKQVTKAMKSANKKKVMYGDLMPQNIFIHKKTIKIGDFSHARIIPQMKMPPIIENPGYMAPQIFKGEPYGEKCDVWSVGNT